MTKKMFAVAMFMAAGALAAPAPPAVPDNSAQYYLKALVLESQGNFQMAEAEIEKALDLQPNSEILYRTLADYAFHLGQLDKASTAIRKAVELDSKDAKALILAGQIDWAKGDRGSAEADLKRSLSDEPDNTEALMLLASAVSSHDPHQAISLYADYLDRHPGQVNVIEQIAQIHENLGEFEEAKKFWEMALELSPDSVPANLALAKIADVHYDTATAISHYDAVLAEDPENLPILLRVGELRYRTNDMAKAEEAFSRAHTLAPQSLTSQFWLALMAENKGDWKEAIRFLEPICAQNGEPGLALRLAYYYSQAGRSRDAIGVLEHLTQKQPSNPDFLGYLIVAYEEGNENEKAADALQRLIRLNPNDPEAHFDLATLYDRMGRPSQSDAELKSAITLKPDYDTALNYLGFTYAERGENLAEAAQLLVRALAISPDNGAYLDSAGWIAFKQGSFQKAAEDLNQAAARERDPVIYDHLGDVYAATLDWMKAIEAWDQSLRMNPSAKPVARKVTEAVRKLSDSDRGAVFVRRALSTFGGVVSMNGLAEVEVCLNGPCETINAELEYVARKSLKIEVPGPLGTPLLLLTKAYGAPAEYGAVHPFFQTVDKEVTHAASRLESVWSGDVFVAFSSTTAPGQLAFERKGGWLEAVRGPLRITFQYKDGQVRKIEWGGDVSEKVELSAYSPVSGAIPQRMEWTQSGEPFIFRLQIVRPVIQGSENGAEK